MSKRQCSHHGSIEPQRVTYTQQDTQVYRDRQAFIKQKKIEKCLEKRLETDLKALEIGRRHTLMNLRTEQHMFKKMTKDRVDCWREQILGQRYNLAPLRQILQQADKEGTTPTLPVISPRSEDLTRSATSLPVYETRPVLPEIASVQRANTSLSDGLRSPSPEERRLTFPHIERPKLKRNVVYSRYGGKLIYESEDPRLLYERVRNKRIELLTEQQQKLSKSVTQFISKS